MARPPVSAVFILWLRQMKLYFRSRARMIGALGQPTLFLLSLGFGLGLTFARAGRGDYVQFLTLGIWDRQFGLFGAFSDQIAPILVTPA